MAETDVLEQPDTSLVPLGGTEAASYVPKTKSSIDALLPDPEKEAKVLGGLGELKRQQIGSQEKAQGEYEGLAKRNRAQMQRAYDAESAGPDNLPPQWDADAERKDRIRGPLENFGSAGMIFATIASMFTRAPMTSALNAGAAAMGAIRESDEKAYESAYSAWKANTELAVKRFNMEHTLFQDANKLLDVDMNQWAIKQKAIAIRFDNQKDLLMLENGMYEPFLKSKEAQAQAASQVMKTMEEGAKFNARHIIYQAETKDFKENHPNATPQEEVRHGLRLLQGWGEGKYTENERIYRDLVAQRERELGEMPSTKEQINLWHEVKQKNTGGGLGTSSGQRTARANEALEAYKTSVGEVSPAESAVIVSAFATPGASGALTAAQMAQTLEAIKKRTQAGNPPSVDERLKMLQKAATAGSGDLSAAGLDAAAERYLKSGRLPPNTGRGAQGQAVSTAIQNRAAELAEERGIDMAALPKKWQQFSASQVAIQRFQSGPQGNVVRSLNVAIDHLSTVDELAKALKNGNLPAFNRFAQHLAEQTGKAAPVNLDAAKAIVGAEIIKAIGVAGAGTKEERTSAAEAWSRARSPAQFEGVTSTMKKLLAGQLRGIRLQATKATGLTDADFNELLLPETIKQLESLESRPAETPGWTIKKKQSSADSANVEAVA